MSIEKAVEEALEHYNTPPPNESNTCDWIILPLLHAAGYARRDISSRVADNNGHFPNYTVLASNASCTWYVEAKAWNVTLEDRHAHQALNYANQNGRRWVVLTNGRTWNLYDNSIQGLVNAKRVLQAHLKDVEAITEFLETIGKQSVVSGQLEATVYALKERQQAEQEAEAAQKQTPLAEVQAVQPAVPLGRPVARAERPMDNTSDEKRLNRFWRMFRRRLQDKGLASDVHRPDWSQAYLAVDKRRGVDCYYYVAEPRRAKVEYVLNKPMAHQHIAQFLRSKQADIEDAVGTKLQWMPSMTGQEYKIRLHIECMPFADAEEQWPEIQEEMISKMLLLQGVLKPLIIAAEARHRAR